MTWKSLKHEPPPVGVEVLLMDSRTSSIRMMPYEWGIGAIGENWSHWIEYTPPEPEKEEWEVVWDLWYHDVLKNTDEYSVKGSFKAGWDARGINKRKIQDECKD